MTQKQKDDHTIAGMLNDDQAKPTLRRFRFKISPRRTPFKLIDISAIGEFEALREIESVLKDNWLVRSWNEIYPTRELLHPEVVKSES